MRTTKVQMNVRIRAYCSGYSLLVDTSVSIGSVSGQRRPRSACANAQADLGDLLGLRCPQNWIHIICFNG